MKYQLLVLILFTTQILFSQAFGQDRITVDLDQDNKLDSIYLKYQSDDAQLVCQLSSKMFEKEASQFIHLSEGDDSHFTLYFEDDVIRFYNHKNHVERTAAYFQYDPTTQNIVLVGMSRSQDGDNDVDGGGGSYLDVSSQTYSGNWSYYDHFDENPEEYRIYMPEIKSQMNFPQINLSDLSTNTFTTYRNNCFQLYQDQFKSIFPNGNNSRDGYLMVDLDDDYEIDSIYFDTFDTRIKTQMFNYETEGMDEISSIPIDFDDAEFEITEESKGHYAISGSSDGKKVNFSYDPISKKFVVEGMAQKNWIHKDLDHDGVVDSVKVFWGDEVYITYQLSTQGFSETKSPNFIANGVVITEKRAGFQFELGFSRSGLTVNYRFDSISKTMQVIGLDFWDMYNESEYSLNLLTSDFIASQMEYDDENGEHQFSIHSKMDYPIVDLESFDDQKIMEFTERAFQILNQSKLQKKLGMDIEGDSFGIGYFTIGPEESIDLGEDSYLNCELSVQIIDSLGKVQQFFIDNVNLTDEIILLYDNKIKFSKDLGYYIEEETPILPKDLPNGKYKIRVILSHQDFEDDIMGEEIEIELPLEIGN